MDEKNMPPAEYLEDAIALAISVGPAQETPERLRKLIIDFITKKIEAAMLKCEYCAGPLDALLEDLTRRKFYVSAKTIKDWKKS